MASVADLAVSVTARTTQFHKAMTRASRKLKRFGRDVSNITRGMRRFAMAVGAAGAVGFVKLARDSEKFNQAFRSSLAIMGNVSAQTRKIMQDTAIAVAKVTKFSAEEAAKSYYYLASAGLDAAQSIKALPAVAQFAQAGMFDMALATDLLTDAQSALGLTVKDAESNYKNMLHLSDVLVRANTIANASVQQFSEALTTKAAAAIRFLGKDMEEGIAVLAAFADQGIKGAEAGTALNIVFRDLSTKAILNAKAFKAAGVAVFDAGGKMRNIADIVRDLENLLGGMSDAQKKATMLSLGFSDKSIVFQQALLGMSDKIRQYEESLRSAAGFTANVASKQLSPFTTAMERLKAAFSSISISLTPFMDRLGGVLNNIAMYLETLAVAGTNFGKRMFASMFSVVYSAAKLIDLLEALRAGFWAVSGTAQVALVAILAPLDMVAQGIHKFLKWLGVDALQGIAITSKVMIDAIGDSAVMAFDKARDAYEKFATGAHARDVLEFGANAIEWANEQAEKLAASIADTSERRLRTLLSDLSAMMVEAEEMKGSWREIDRSRFTIPGLQQSPAAAPRIQKVQDPQVRESNRLLEQIMINTGNQIANIAMTV